MITTASFSDVQSGENKKPTPPFRPFEFVLVSLVLLTSLFASACSNPSLERLTGGVAAPGGTPEATTDADAATETTAPADATTDGPIEVPTAVFAARGDDKTDGDTPGPVPTGAYLVARPRSGRAANDGSGAYFLPVFDEPDSAARTLLYEYPDGATIEYPLTNPTFFGNELVLRVVDGIEGDEWIQVQAPVRPSGQTVWVKGEDFEFRTTDSRIEIDLADTTLRVYDGDERLLSTRVAYGKIDQPTPLGLSYVNELIAQPLTAGGPTVFNLALFSEVVNNIGGALPAITLHGMSDRSELGKRVTSGTMRAPSDIITSIGESISAGALVIIYDSSDPQTDRDAILASPTEPATTQLSR